MIYEPMAVELERSERAVRPNPLCDLTWTRIEKLRWRAGVIKTKTGLTVTFDDTQELRTVGGGAPDYEYPEVLGVCVAGPKGGWILVAQFDNEVDNFLNAVEIGAEVAQRL